MLLVLHLLLLLLKPMELHAAIRRLHPFYANPIRLSQGRSPNCQRFHHIMPTMLIIGWSMAVHTGHTGSGGSSGKG